MKYATEIFALPVEGEALLYAPLLGVVARTNRAGVNLLRRLHHTPDMLPTSAEADFLVKLAQLGLTHSAEGIKLSRPDEEPFVPRCGSLFLTDACNLRCIYCYASGGDAPNPTVLDFEAGAEGIKYVARLVKQNGEEEFGITFHGAGEPTMAWDLLERLTNYARQVGEQNNLRVSIATCTNGVMIAEHARWLTRHTDGAAVSLDGDAASQDMSRPFRSGAGSFDHVARTLDIFKEEGFNHMIRATITAGNVRRMSGMVDMMADRFSPTQLRFVPVLVSGRCLESNCGAVDPDTFAEEFMCAYDRALLRGVELGFSSLSINSLRTYYCCAVSNGFSITHNGLITSCYDVCRPDHPFARQFVYGAYNPKTKQIEVDRKKIARLRSRNTAHLQSCRYCFCKYMCGGNCAVNAMRQGYDFIEGGGRCRITQAISTYMLARKAETFGQHVSKVVVAADGSDFSLASAAWADGYDNEMPILLGGARFPVQESCDLRPLSREEGVRPFISAGNMAYRRKNYTKALHQYEQARQLVPRSSEAHINMALTFHKLGRLEEALINAEQAVTLAEHDSSSHMTHGKVLAACGRMAEALTAFDRVLALEPNRADARYNRAWVLSELGRVPEAEAVLTDLVTALGPGSDADVLLQSLRLHQGAGGAISSRLAPGSHAWMLALNVQLQASDGIPEASGDRAKLATVLDDCSREQYGKARRTLDELLQAYPTFAPLRGLSGMLWQALAKPELANLELKLAGDVFREQNGSR